MYLINVSGLKLSVFRENESRVRGLVISVLPNGGVPAASFVASSGNPLHSPRSGVVANTPIWRIARLNSISFGTAQTSPVLRNVLPTQQVLLDRFYEISIPVYYSSPILGECSKSNRW